jgi:CHAT domain-containing protein
MTENKLRIIVTTPEIQLARDAPVTEKQLNGTIAEFRQRLDTRDDYRMSGNQLYNWLIKPIADDLAQAQSKVLMVYLDSTLRATFPWRP